MGKFKQYIFGLLLQSLLIGCFISTTFAKTFVYVSAAADGTIAIFNMDLKTGGLKTIGKVRVGKMVMPLVLSPDRRFLYASIRSKPYSVSSYAVDGMTGGLALLSTVPLPDNMAYISTDKTGRFLLSASYAGDKISVNPIGEQGFVQGEVVQVMPTGRNAHAVRTDPSNRFAYVTNLGSDQVMELVFDEDTGILTPNKPAAVHLPAGSGPRHFSFAPNTEFVYLIDELDGLIHVYALESGSGQLREIQKLSAVPPDAGLVPGKPRAAIAGGSSAPGAAEESSNWIWTADIHITPDGKFLYASERTTSTLAAFAVDTATGKLRYINSFDTETQPREFAIGPDGNFLICAGQKSGHISVHRINRETGELIRINRYRAGNDPAWVEIVDYPEEENRQP